MNFIGINFKILIMINTILAIIILFTQSTQYSNAYISTISLIEYKFCYYHLVARLAIYRYCRSYN